MLGAIITGLIAGWLAGKLMRGAGYGIIRDIVLGLVGGVIGGWLFGHLGIGAGGMVGAIVMSTIGAVVLVAAARMIHSL